MAKESEFNTGQRNVNDGKFGSRRYLIKIYSLFALLIVTLALIGILEYANRGLPTNSGAHYNPLSTGTESISHTAKATSSGQSTLLVTKTGNVRKRQVQTLVPGNVSVDITSTSSSSSLSTSSSASITAATTELFVPPVVTAAPASTCPGVSQGCTCPSDNEVPDCSCTVNSAAAICTCTFLSDTPDESGANTHYFRQCTCPPDPCTTCMCPADPSGVSSRRTPCSCPEDPVASGCSCVSSAPFDSTLTMCDGARTCTCGVLVKQAQCVPPVAVSSSSSTSTTSTTSTPEPVTNSTTSSSTIFPSFTPVINTTDISSSSFPSPSSSIVSSVTPIATLNSTTPIIRQTPIPSIAPNLTTTFDPTANCLGAETGCASIPMVILTTTINENNFTTVVPVTIIPSGPVIANSSSVPASLSSSIDRSETPVILSASPPTRLPPTTSVSVSSLPVSVPPGQTSVTPIVSMVTTTNSRNQVIVTPITVTPSVIAPIISLSTTTNAESKVIVIPVTVVPSLLAPIVSLSTSTNSQGQVFVNSVTITPTATPLAPSRPPILSLSVGTNSLGVVTTGTITLTPATTAPTGIIFFVSNSQISSDGTVIGVTPVTFLQAQANPSLPAITSSGSVLSIPTAYIEPNATPGPQSGGSGAGGGGGGGGGTNTPGKTSSSKFTLRAWPQAKTFLGGYMPVILAKFYNMAWGTVFYAAVDSAAVNMLTNPNGATVAQLISGMDGAAWLSFVPFIASMAAVPFVTDSVYFDTNYGCDNPNPLNPTNPCWPPKMTANTWVIRTVQSLLSVTALSTVVLIAMWFKKPHGSTNDPTSIAAVAAIAGHPDVQRDFAVDVNTSESDLKRMMKNKRYTLTEFPGDGTQLYGLVPMNVPDSDGKDSFLSKVKGFFGSIFGSKWKNKAFALDVMFVAYLIGLLAIVGVHIANVDKTSLMDIFQGSSVGKRIFFAVLAAVVSINLGRIERDTQTLTPYAELRNLNATPKETILLRRHTIPLTSILPMLLNRHYFAFTVAFAALLAEFLIITLSGLPYRPGQLRSEFVFCAISSCIILVNLIIVMIGSMVWRAFVVPELPRKPDNVASVMTYVCESRMVRDFAGLERASQKERDKAIISLDKRYGYGMVEKQVGKKSWAVDDMGGNAGR
ncbi:hypothetical protein BT63DRAFT_459042 [Microthyrium microscopicum]|uniref:Uncharacterized protein n=1 Tax=Microthyrium microscopicum TaxID=703497 RepID=A0A6A6U3D8_9PEZI|nr:hypothetical protein BT63DRAFT_459042 [Microthyrium microscopicum]